MNRKKSLLVVIAIIMCLCITAVPTFATNNLPDDPNVTIISPSNHAVMKSGKVLVSVKLTVPSTIRVSLYSVSDKGKALITSENYSSSKPLSYYTKELSGLNGGVYCMNVSTLNSTGVPVYDTEVYIKVKKHAASSFQIDVFNSKDTSDSFWSYLLKKLLG